MQPRILRLNFMPFCLLILILVTAIFPRQARCLGNDLGTLSSLEAELRNAQTAYVEAIRNYGSAHSRSLQARNDYLLAKERVLKARDLIQAAGTSAASAKASSFSFDEALLPPPDITPDQAVTANPVSSNAATGAVANLSDTLCGGLPTLVNPPSKADILRFKYGVITASRVNIRTGAGTWNSIIKTLPSGTAFQVEDYSNGWYKVKFSDGSAGWIAGWLVSTSLEPQQESSEDSSSFGGQVGGSFIASGTVTSEYGYRSDPFTGEKRFHSGIDIGAPRGTEVLALGEGKVIFAGWNGGYGRLVKIQYDNGYTAYYAHLDDYAGMTVGTTVSRGQTVGKVDSSGRSTGNHLHFEIRDEQGQTLDPRSLASVVIP